MNRYLLGVVAAVMLAVPVAALAAAAWWVLW